MNAVTYDKLSKHARLIRVVLMLGVFLLPTSYSHADIINPNGGADDDILNGGAGTYDICDGGAGTGDTATASCEIVIDVP